MSFNQILKDDLVGKGVTGLPDTPELSTTEMQRKFDELSLEVLVPKYNELVVTLLSIGAASLIGANAPSLIGASAQNNIQSILDAIGALASTAKQSANDAIKTANDASSKVNSLAEETEKTIISYTFGIDPVTGKYLPVNQIVENLYTSMRTSALTAEQYRALGLTVEQYASYQITARDYAYYGAEILGK
jgi:hypothetical protein